MVDGFLNPSPPYYSFIGVPFVQSLSLNPKFIELTDSARLGSQQATSKGAPISSLLVLGSQVHTARPNFLTQALKITQVLMIVQKNTLLTELYLLSSMLITFTKSQAL